MFNWKHKLTYSSLLVAALYFFIVSIELIKNSALKVGSDYSDYFMILSRSPAKAVGVGWIASAIVQSGGAVAATATTFVGAGVLSLASAFFLILGTRLGATATGLIAALFTRSKLKKGFRHGFEIAAANNIYNLSLVFVMFIFEYFTQSFGKIGVFFGMQFKRASFLTGVPDVIKFLTGWIVDVVLRAPTLVSLLAGFILLIAMLELFVRVVLGLFGGRDLAHKKIHKFVGTSTKAFLAGLIITMLIPSTNVTVSLLVPLAAVNIISLREAIPFIIGANIGTVVEVVVASIVTGNAFSVATATIYVLFTIIGAAIWLPNMDYLHRATKYVCKHSLKISRRKAVIYFAAFMILPIVMILLL